MSQNNSNSKVNKMNIGDEEIVSLENTSDFDELDETDIKLIKLLELDESPEPPDFIGKNLLKAYEEEFRYKILWTKFKDHLMELVSFSPYTFMARHTSLFVASMVISIGLGAFLYYQYRTSKNINQAILIYNQQTLPINVTQSPVLTPQIKSNTGTTSDNGLNGKKTIIAIESVKDFGKGGKTKGKTTLDNNQIAHNTDPTINIREIFRGEEGKDTELSIKIEKVYIGYLGDIDENQELEKQLILKLKEKGFKIFTSEEIGISNPDLSIIKEEQDGKESITLIDASKRILFKKSVSELMLRTPKEQADIILEEIEKHKNLLSPKN